MKDKLELGDVKKGDIVKVYFTLLQHMYGGFCDTLEVSSVAFDDYNCESFISPFRYPVPFTINDIIALYRRNENLGDYKLIWYDEKHKEDI